MSPDYPAEVRKRLDRLTAVEHQQLGTREDVTRHEAQLTDLTTRVNTLEHNVPLNKLVRGWVITGIGVLALAVLTAVVALVLPKVFHLAPPAATAKE